MTAATGEAPRSWGERLKGYLHDEPVFPIAVLFGLTWADQVDTQSFNVLGPEIADHFGVGEGVLGTLGILAVIVGPIIGLPLSYLADRWRRVPLAIGGAIVWGVFSIFTGLAPVLWFLLVARIISTSGEIVNTPVHGSLISDYYSPKTRMKVFGIYNVGQSVGGALGAVLAGVLGQAFGWRVPFIVLAVPTFLIILVAFRLAEPARGRFERVETATPPIREAVQKLWALRSLRYQWIGATFAVAALLPARQIFPFFLRDNFHVGAGWRGVIVGVGTVLTFGASLTGTAAIQRRLNVRASDGLRAIAWLGFASGVAIVLSSMSPLLGIVVLLLWAIYALFAVLAPSLLALTAIIAGPEVRSTAFALQGVVALAGAPLALVGVAIGDKHHRLALFYCGALFLIGIKSFFTASRYVDADVARLDPAYRARAGRSSADGGPPILLETQGITVSYGGVQVLFGVDIEVRAGEIVALLGTNGAGKSTTLNAISGVVEPDGGNVWFEGEPITGEPPERTVGRGIVQVPGGRGVFPRLTVEDNLKMGAFLVRRDKAAVARRTAEAFDMFPALANRRRELAGVLSGGERQMLTIAQSFLLQPKLLLIDELSLGLAPAVVQGLLQTIRNINATGTAIVLVEQSVNVALTLADRAYFMEKGEVRFSGPTTALLDRTDLLRSVFLEGVTSTRDLTPVTQQVPADGRTRR